MQQIGIMKQLSNMAASLPAKVAYHHWKSLLFIYDFMLHRDLAKTLTVMISHTILFMDFYWINTYDYYESFQQDIFLWAFTKANVGYDDYKKHNSLIFILIKSLERVGRISFVTP